MYQVCGLFTPDNSPVPLDSVHADIKIIDCVSHVTLTQTYTNKGQERLEASYRFPIYAKAAICEFEAEVDGRMIKGVVKEKESAVKEYETALASGQQAFLLEQREQSDIFQASVGNVPPGKSVIVRIGYVSEIKNDDQNDKLRFVLPTTIAPRYQAPNDSQPPSITGKMTGPIGATNVDDRRGSQYGLTVDLLAEMTGDITSVESPSHPIAVSNESPKKTRVKLSLNNTHLDKDFVVNIASKQFDTPRVMVETDEKAGTNCVMLTFVPKFNAPDIKCEFIFVVDRSGSMGGFKIEQARAALTLFVKSMPEDCYFNIISFGSTYQCLFPQSRKYSGTTLEEGVAHISTFDAHMGGTEIKQPMQFIFGQPAIEVYTRQIFLLTDGEVSNTQELKTMCRDNCALNGPRVFTLGIGNAVSHDLVEGMAEAGYGDAQFVMENERFEKKILRHLKLSMMAVMSDLFITWANDEDIPVMIEEVKPVVEKKSVAPPPSNTLFDASVNEADLYKAPEKKLVDIGDFDITKAVIKQAPAKTPVLMPGQRFLAFALIKDHVPLPKSIKLSAKSSVGPISIEVPISTKKVVKQGEEKSVLHILAARRLVDDLQNAQSFAHLKLKCAREEVTGKPSEKSIKSAIISLCLQYNIMSNHTAFVAVDKEGKPIDTKEVNLKRVSVPTMVDAGGFGGAYAFAGIARGRAIPMMAAVSPMPTMKMSHLSGDLDHNQKAKFLSMVASAPGVRAHYSMACDAPMMAAARVPQMEGFVPQASYSSIPQDPHDILYAILKFQDFSGFFLPQRQLLRTLNVKKADSLNLAVEASKIGISDADLAEKMWVTCLVLHYFENKLAALKDEWELVHQKALKWLDARCLSQGGSVSARKLIEKVATYF